MKQKEIDDLIKQIKSGDEKSVDSSISKIREEGDASLLNSIIEEYKGFLTNVQKKVAAVISDIQDQALAEFIVEHIKSTTDKQTRSMLLTSAWNSRLDYMEYMETFIDMVINEEFEIAFEAFTVVENAESKVTKERKEELIRYVKQEICKCGEQTLVLAHDIVGIIEKYEEL